MVELTSPPGLYTLTSYLADFVNTLILTVYDIHFIITQIRPGFQLY